MYYRPIYQKPGKRLNKIAVLVGILIIAGGIYFWYQNSRYNYFISTPVDPTNLSNVSLLIKNGENTNQIADSLAKKDLILNADAFKKYVRDNEIDRKIIAGRFLLNKSMTIPTIAETLTDNKKSESILTVPEGSTIKDIDDKLVNLKLIQPGEFIQAIKNFKNYKKYPFLDEQKNSSLVHPLEGFLFPDTYFLNPNTFSPEDLIDLMLKNFQKKVPTSLVEASKEKNRSLFDIITMASIVEKEVRTTNDIPIVAGILWKRLDSNWQIGADATLLYLKNDGELSKNDLKEDSAYNTRKKTGLPQGPISNPGLKSIEATLNPEDSAYYYYLTKPDTGEVVYAKTNDEQNANKAKYLY